MKLKTSVTSLALQQIKEVDAVSGQEDILPNIECTCKIQWYTILMLTISFRPISFCHSTHRKIRTVQGTLVLQCSKIMLLISDEQYYVSVKFCRMAGSIHLFKITGTLVPENVKLK